MPNLWAQSCLADARVYPMRAIGSFGAWCPASLGGSLRALTMKHFSVLSAAIAVLVVDPSFAAAQNTSYVVPQTEDLGRRKQLAPLVDQALGCTMPPRDRRYVRPWQPRLRNDRSFLRIAPMASRTQHAMPTFKRTSRRRHSTLSGSRFDVTIRSMRNPPSPRRSLPAGEHLGVIGRRMVRGALDCRAPR